MSSSSTSGSWPRHYVAEVLPNSNRRIHSLFLPKLMVTNARSIMNKVDELRMLINDKQPDVCCICESWITSDTATERYSIEGYNIFNNCRSNRKGGGILTYAKDNIAAEIFSDIVVPDELEAQWLVLKHPRLPRVAPYIVLGSVYLPSGTEAENVNVMLTHLHTCVDLTRVKKPQAGIFICGDLNRLNISSLCTGNKLKQIIKVPTRGDNILDVVLTNLRELYNSPTISAPIDHSDHNVIEVSPPFAIKNNTINFKKVRPMPESKLSLIGRWAQAQSWEEVLQAKNTQAKADAFYMLVNNAIDKILTIKNYKVSQNG
ncbi:uncharacterized protein LOC117101408 [Anneissia japonica]|uniref:uncharacterized protein LOC117101408 n=1 Tax=Anneissia japonica TaxID=1529436 RepID=UPI001425800D|nr:uncharacterized protein LOC117101408 [Anneissia japonica]